MSTAHPIVALAANVATGDEDPRALDEALRGHVGKPTLEPTVRALLEFACFLWQRPDTKPSAQLLIDALRPLRSAVDAAQSRAGDRLATDPSAELCRLLGGVPRTGEAPDGPSMRWWEL